ncbi:PREDICTED: probable 3-ketoacyl-CoA synthase 20 [Brassica oleracea var. oleracea]|uniref:3-ketoacyl-CoA synthase n=1 Tax=Brassica oleracea var. oleracea TaxID=109376 RepID=A0A0D3AX05_BRAOL|nr:PREDICTED: probable 3-ketoacyl-CoA synthase 20 [Brassica oleracea var. oleracea]
MNQTMHKASPISLTMSELTTLLSSSGFIFEIFISLLVLHLIYQRLRRRVKVYLLDFTCYRAPDSNRLPMSTLLETIYLANQIDQESIDFQARILERSWLSNQTSIPPSLTEIPLKKSLTSVQTETMTTIFTSVDDLLKKNKISPRSIDILITNCSLHAPTPSLSAMVINKFHMRSNIKSFNLSGMGCAAGILSVSLANDLVKVHRGSLALIVSTEALNTHWYIGKDRSMLLTNCLFRMGAAAVLMSSNDQDRGNAKYELLHVVRTNKAKDDRAYQCIYQDTDSELKQGVSITKDVISVAGDVLKMNLSTLGPLVLPYLELLQYVICKIYKPSSTYTPNFKKAFEHFCIHTGGRAVIQAMEMNLNLKKEDIEPSKMTLHRFGNTSSSSVWYALSYLEAKRRVKRGDKVLQIAFGSGFKCNSAVWRCIREVEPDTDNKWLDFIESYPVDVPDSISIRPC